MATREIAEGAPFAMERLQKQPVRDFNERLGVVSQINLRMRSDRAFLDQPACGLLCNLEFDAPPEHCEQFFKILRILKK